MMVTLEIMNALWPKGNTKVPGLIEGIVSSAPAVFKKYGLTSSLTAAHAMAQFSHECGAGLEMVENIRYSAERAAQVWPSRFHNAQDVYRVIGSYQGDADFSGKLIDSVYGTRMGNRPGTHDGRNFIGRGLAQTTGREGYEKLATKTGLDVVNHPELVSAPTTALECGVADFVICGCLPFAVQDNVYEVTKHLNGGTIGLAERTAWLWRWKAALVQSALNGLGGKLTVDGNAGNMTGAAIRKFEQDNNLPVDGTITIRLLAAIDNKLKTTQGTL